MGKIFVFMGKSAAGKDTLYKRIMEMHRELLPVIPYTTRPIRSGEADGNEYFFVTKEKMDKLESDGKIVEKRCYNTVKGPWYYFTADDGQIDFSKGNYCYITTLEGYIGIRDYFGEDKVVPIYIEVDQLERMRRSLEREAAQKKPCVAEVCRRFLADEEDFSDENLRRAKIEESISNMNLEEAVKKIEKLISRKEGDYEY